MSAEYEGQDPIAIAQQAERDLNSNAAKTGASTESSGNRRGANASDSSTFESPRDATCRMIIWTELTPVTFPANESGVDQNVESKFPGSTVTYGSSASGAGDNREIPVSEGGDVNPDTGKCVPTHTYTPTSSCCKPPDQADFRVFPDSSKPATTKASAARKTKRKPSPKRTAATTLSGAISGSRARAGRCGTRRGMGRRASRCRRVGRVSRVVGGTVGPGRRMIRGRGIVGRGRES